MKKRIFTLILAIAIPIMLLAACGSSPEPVMPERGVWNDNVYTNEYLGLEFTLPNNWTISTDEQLAALVNISADILEVPAGMIEGMALYDMMASGPLGSSVMVMYERLLPATAGISEADYLAELATELEMTGLGYSNFVFSDSTTRIGSVGYHSLSAVLSMGGMEIVQYYFINRQDEFIRGIIVTLIGDDTLEDILANFN